MKIELLNKDNLVDSGHLLYSVTSGSHAYGTNLPTSDMDTRGVYWIPTSEYMRLDLDEVATENMLQIGDEKHDITYYSLRRFLDLVKTANPNLIELLWIPSDCIRYKHPYFDILLNNKYKFITKKAFETHARYAASQVSKARGANKRVNNPQKEERPQREDFCFVINFKDNFDNFNDRSPQHVARMIEENIFPSRPRQLIDFQRMDKRLDLSKCHVAALEHVPNTYRLYDFSDDPYVRGVFQNNALVCQNISKDDEWKRFIGLLIYNENEYEKAVREWQQYWTWMKERNSARWVDQEKGLLNYDQKNMCHCVRLMLSVQHIFKNGEPIVRFGGENLRTLMAIRRGELTYDAIIGIVNELSSNVEALMKVSTLPDAMDTKFVSELFNEITTECEKNIKLSSGVE